nr:MAG TPA: hypothetical protein [Caudoviricetes sp.]
MPSLLTEEGSTTRAMLVGYLLIRYPKRPLLKSKCCNKHQKTHKGYEWYFLEDFNKDIV